MEENENKRTSVIISDNGPIIIEGEIDLVAPNGNISEYKKCYLCRCGSSEKKPFCDGSHKKIDFKG